MIELLKCAGCGASSLNPVGPFLCCDYCGAKSVREESRGSSRGAGGGQVPSAEVGDAACSTCGISPSVTHCAFCGKSSCPRHRVEWRDFDFFSCMSCDGLPMSQELRSLSEAWNELGHRAAPAQLELISSRYQRERLNKRVARTTLGLLCVLGALVGLFLALLLSRITHFLEPLMILCLPLMGAFLLFQWLGRRFELVFLNVLSAGRKAQMKEAETEALLTGIRDQRVKIRVRQAEIFEELGR